MGVGLIRNCEHSMKRFGQPGLVHIFGGQFLSALFAASVLGANGPQPPAASPVRERLSFNADWLFIKDDPADTGDKLSYTNITDWVNATGNEFSTNAPRQRPAGNLGADVPYTGKGFDDSAWRKLNLPHDWGIEGPFKQEYPGETGKLPWWGVAWYRKHFEVPLSDQSRRISLEVDGAMSYATVWLNGKFVGGWPFGYASWQLDLTPYVKFGGENVLAIRLDNPQSSSRWYPGGGIYRNVWLVKSPPVHVAQWGTYVTTPDVKPDAATVNIRVNVDNESDFPSTLSVRSEICELDAADHRSKPLPWIAVSSVQVEPHQTRAGESQVVLKYPKLWSLQTPQRYLAITSLEDNGKLLDRYETTFGIRTIEFTATNGFLLNGQRVPINGVCD